MKKTHIYINIFFVWFFRIFFVFVCYFFFFFCSHFIFKLNSFYKKNNFICVFGWSPIRYTNRTRWWWWWFCITIITTFLFILFNYFLVSLLDIITNSLLWYYVYSFIHSFIHSLNDDFYFIVCFLTYFFFF